MEQIQKGCGVSITGDTQEPPRHNPGPRALGWPRLSTEVGPDYPLWSLPTCLIRWFCGWTVKCRHGKVMWPVPQMMSTTSLTLRKEQQLWANDVSMVNTALQKRTTNPKRWYNLSSWICTPFSYALNTQNPNNRKVSELLKCLWCDVPLETLKGYKVKHKAKHSFCHTNWSM